MDGNAGGDGGNGKPNTGAGSGGGSGPTLTPGTENSQDGAGTGQSSAGTPGAGTNPPKLDANDWRNGLSAELQSDEVFNKFKSVTDLAQSYKNAQRLIGADKIPVPKNATPEEWANIMSRLGLPADIKDYGVKFADDHGFAPAFMESFKAEMYANGILPPQAQKLVDWATSNNKKDLESRFDSRKATEAKELEGLKAQWGAKFDQNVASAQAMLKEIATPEEIAALQKAGLTQNLTLIRLLGNAGAKFLKEDGLPAEGGGQVGAMTPGEASAAITAIMADSKHPYFVKDDPRHAAAVAEVTKLHTWKKGRKA